MKSIANLTEPEFFSYVEMRLRQGRFIGGARIAFDIIKMLAECNFWHPSVINK